MGELIDAKTWRIQGKTVTLPVRITDAQLASAVFTTHPSAAATCLTGTGLHPFTLAGRAFSVLMLVHYGEFQLGTYDEVGIGLLTRGPHRRIGLYVVDLPVTGEFTREVGQDVWALPKWIMRCDLQFHGESASVTVHDRDTFVMRASLRAGRIPVPFTVRSRMPTWSRIDHGAQANVLLRGSAPMHLHGLHTGRGHAHIELGDHPMARHMAALGMTRRPMLTMHARRLTGDLDAFEPVA